MALSDLPPETHSSISPLPSFLFLSSSPNHGELTNTGGGEGFDASRLLFLASLWLYQGGGIGSGSGVGGSDSGGGGGGSMDLSKVGERILSSVRSARALGLLGSSSAEDRPEVPARAAAAAAVARALASVPPHQRLNLPSSSEESSFIYGIKHHGEVVDELEEEFYEEEFDPVMHVLEQVLCEEDELEYYEKKATLRLAQLDKIAERLSRHVMEHHEEMVRGMHLVSEVERDLKIATIICKNGRRHLTSSMNEVSRDLIVTSNSKKKQALLDMLPVLTELQHALNLQKALEFHVEEGNYCKAFQVLSEYLQLLDSLSKLSAAQEMSRNVEVWLGKTLQKLDALLLQVCQEFVEEKYITVVDAYALIGDVPGLAEKVQSFFMQEVLVETHSILKALVEEDLNMEAVQNSSRLTYGDLCLRIPESKFRQCLLKTLAALFMLMCSYYAIMSFEPDSKASQMQDNLKKEDDVSGRSEVHQKSVSGSSDYAMDNGLHKDCAPVLSSTDECQSTSSGSLVNNGFHAVDLNRSADVVIDEETSVSGDGSPWYELRKDATGFVSQSLQRGRKSLWQLTTTRVSVLLSSAAFNSTSIHQFVRNYDDLKVFILSGEAFCGAEAVEFRNKLTVACEHYFSSFHRQNIHALRMVLEKETWQKLPAEAVQTISFSGLVGDGVALITQSVVNSANAHVHQTNKFSVSAETGIKKDGFSYWFSNVNPFITESQASTSFSDGASAFGEPFLNSHDSPRSNNISSRNNTKGENTVSEDENEDLLADFIDEDSQLPSRVSKPCHPRKHSSQWKGEEAMVQTGTSLCLLRFIDKYARLMQKLEIINVELFKGARQLFGVYYHYLFQTFGQNAYPNGKTLADSLNYRLKTALNRVTEDCDQWVKSQLAQSASSSPVSFNEAFKHMDVAPATPPGTTSSHPPNSSFGLKERCTAVDTIIFVARILHRAKPHLQQMMLQSNATIVEDFFVYLVDSVPDLVEHIHRTTARLLLHINGYVDRIANAKWEVKELGMEHNGYVDLLLGEFKHYRTRIIHGDIHKEVQELLLDYGVEIVAETLVEGLSRVKRCTDEGRALMSLDLQVLINGLQHFVSKDPRPKLQIVETFVKAYYLPETEFVHWARAHPEYTKSQIIGLINLVATMKSWKRKTRLEVLEKIE